MSRNAVKVELVRGGSPYEHDTTGDAPEPVRFVDHSRDSYSGARAAADDPRVREATLNIVREVDRLLREGPQPTTESKLRGWLNTPGLRALIYEGGSGR